MPHASEVVDLETQFWQTMIGNDVRTAVDMLADKATVTGAQGVAVLDSDSFAKMMREGSWELKKFDLRDPKVSFPADGVAVIAYKVAETLIVDGEELKMEAADASAWVRDGKGWRCALHTESVLVDPFGRDRRPA